MPYYTNRISLSAAYGEDEVNGLLQQGEGSSLQDPDLRLQVAAAQAQGEIDTYLLSAGYGLPLTFTETAEGAPSDLPGLLQKCSDALTAHYLASSEDLHKQKYDLDRAEAIKYLEALLENKLRLAKTDGTVLTRAERPDGNGLVTVRTRDRIFWRRVWPWFAPREPFDQGPY